MAPNPWRTSFFYSFLYRCREIVVCFVCPVTRGAGLSGPPVGYVLSFFKPRNLIGTTCQIIVASVLLPSMTCYIVTGHMFLRLKPRSLIRMNRQIVVGYVFLFATFRSLVRTICQIVVGYVFMPSKLRNLIQMSCQIVVGYVFLFAKLQSLIEKTC